MSVAKVTTGHSVTVSIELDEPLHGFVVLAVTHVRITVSSAYEDGPRVVLRGYAYRHDGSVGTSPRMRDWQSLDALPRWLVQAAERAYRHELARLSTMAAFPADSPIEAARRRHTDSNNDGGTFQ